MIYDLLRVLALSHKIAFEKTQFSDNMAFTDPFFISCPKKSQKLLYFYDIQDTKTIDTQCSWLRLSSAIYIFRDTLFIFIRQNIALE